MAQQRACGGSAQGDHELGRNQAQLLVEPPVAGLDLARAWLDVQPPLATQLELEMLDGIADINGVAFDAGVQKSAFQYGSGGTDERMTLQIFRVPGGFADEHDRRR